jgi:hypothetical protein
MQLIHPVNPGIQDDIVYGKCELEAKDRGPMTQHAVCRPAVRALLASEPSAADAPSGADELVAALCLERAYALGGHCERCGRPASVRYSFYVNRFCSGCWAAIPTVAWIDPLSRTVAEFQTALAAALDAVAGSGPEARHGDEHYRCVKLRADQPRPEDDGSGTILYSATDPTRYWQHVGRADDSFRVGPLVERLAARAERLLGEAKS